MMVVEEKMLNYTMKTILFTGLLIFFTVGLIPQIQSNPAVMVTDYTLEPETLMPGDTAELTVTLTNTEKTSTKTDTAYMNGQPVEQITDTIAATIENVWISADGDGTYSIKASKNYENIGDLSPGSSISLSFEISAHDNISAGLYNPIFNVDVDSHQDVQFPIPIRVSTFSATILPKEVPKKISSSGSTSITLTVVNNREATVEDVTVTASSNQTLSVSPVSTYIGMLESESSQDISCALHPSVLGEQQISFTVSYRNGENTHAETIDIPIQVIETHDVSPVLFTMPDSIVQHGSERITLEIYNAKSDTITGVTVIPVTDFSTSPSEYFIGSMDADDVFSASFDIHSDELETGEYSIGFKVAFKQMNNYFESPIVSDNITVVPNNSNTQSLDTNLLFGVIGVIVIIILVVFFMLWKRRINK